MENNEDELNIYKTNARLFQILSYTSEAERRKLKSALIANLSKSESRKHLSVLIPNLSVTKRLELLKKQKLVIMAYLMPMSTIKIGTNYNQY